MKRSVVVLAAACLCVLPWLVAGDDSDPVKDFEPGWSSADAETDVAEGAKEAVDVVEGFSRALVAGDMDKAAKHLHPEVLVLENGAVDRDRAAYLEDHAPYDVEFLQSVRTEVQRRTARVSDDLVWVTSESEMDSVDDGELETRSFVETMILRNTDDEWRIVHIHWSS